MVRTTLTIDDNLYAKAVELTGMHEKSALFRASLKALIEQESARRLAALGGSEPEMVPVTRRQSDEK